MKLYDPAVIRAIKNKYGFRFSKSLGQNFLTSKEVIDGIVDGADIGPEDLVIEIGPGIGVLTAAAAERAGKVIAIEIDSNLIVILADTLEEYDNVEVINENVMKLDLAALIRSEMEGVGAGDAESATHAAGPAEGAVGAYRSVKIIGNLPYYITTNIIMMLLESRIPCESITVMMQKEVAERIKADPGSRIYGALSVAVQYYCRVVTVEEVPKENFLPVPKVDSTVLRLDVREQPAVQPKDDKMFFRCVRAGFSMRRKTLLNSLTATGFSKDEIRTALAAAGIEQSRRAETLSLEEFAALADAFTEVRE